MRWKVCRRDSSWHVLDGEKLASSGSRWWVEGLLMWWRNAASGEDFHVDSTRHIFGGS